MIHPKSGGRAALASPSRPTPCDSPTTPRVHTGKLESRTHSNGSPSAAGYTAWLAVPGWPYEVQVQITVGPEIRVRSRDRRVTTRSGRVLHLRGQELATFGGHVRLCHAGHSRIRSLKWVVGAALSAVSAR